MVVRRWRNAAALLTALVTLAIPSPALAAYYPDRGDLYYNGGQFAESYFKWTDPGPWQKPDPGYEHDFAFDPGYLSACTSWTDLPYAYDDCPTAGYSEPSNLWTFSFGSFHVAGCGR
ncbi:MAG: hypothetical protein ACYC3V_15200, partial [Chloroflexota bacterium]